MPHLYDSHGLSVLVSHPHNITDKVLTIFFEEGELTKEELRHAKALQGYKFWALSQIAMRMRDSKRSYTYCHTQLKRHHII